MMADTIRYAFLDGGSYDGHCEPQKSLAHGRGKRIFDDDSTYDGSWNEGRMEGHGVMKFGSSCPSLYSFDGNWVNNKFQGEGTLLYRYFHVTGVQAKFEGGFHDGKRHGNGLGTFADGESYEGDWEDDKRQGFGSQIWRNGDRYLGQWKEDTRNGFGVYSGPRGDYEGQWKEDKRHGVGKQTDRNGDCYEGEWKNDQRHGVGFLRWGTGHCYSGGWQRDKRHGVGTQEWSNGDHYTGEWEGDQPVGFFGGDIVFSSPSSELTIVRGKTDQEIPRYMDPPNDLKPVDGGKLPERDVEMIIAELKSQIKRLEYGETELRHEFPRRESYMSGIQNQLESQAKRLERKEKKLVTSRRQNEQVSSDLESENKTLKDKERQLREDFAFREKQLRHLLNELQSEVTKLKQGEAKTRDELAANDREHQRIQRDLQQRLQDRESDLQQALARRMVDNSPRLSVPNELQIENTQLRNALTSMRADRDAKARDYESEVKELREKETELQNRLISLRETKESEIREIQDELQRVQRRETGLQNRLTSTQTFDRSQIQDLQNKLESQKSIHDAEVSSLKKSFRNEKAISTATQEQLARLKESHETAITSLQQELLAEEESRCKGEGLVSPPTVLPSSQRNAQSQSPPLVPAGMPPSTIPSTTIQSRPSFQPPPTTKLPGWYDSPSSPTHQTVPPNPTTTSYSYPSAPYNPSQVNSPAQHTNRGEPQYRPPFKEPTREIRIGNTPPEQSFPDKNSSGPPQTFTPGSYYPASSPYPPLSVTSYNTVPQTPNSINSVPLPSLVSSTTDFRYHVAGSYFSTIGSPDSNQNQAKSTNQQTPERIQPQTGQRAPTVQSPSYQTTVPPQTYIPSQPTDRQRDREGPSVDKTVWASQPGQSTSHTTSLSHERPEVRETNIGDDEWAVAKAPKAARPTVPQTTGPTVFGPAGQHTKDVQAYTYPPSIVSQSYYGQVDKAATAESTTPYSSTSYTSSAPVLHQSYYATSENKTTIQLYQPSNLPLSNYPPHSVPPSMNPYSYNQTPQMYGTADLSSISETTNTGGPVPTVSYEARYPTQQYSSSRPPVEQSLLSRVRGPPVRPGGPRRLTKWDPEMHVSSRERAPHSQTRPLQLEYSVYRHMINQDENSGVEEDEDGYTEGSDEGDDDMEDEDEDTEGSNEGRCDDDLECLRYIRFLERMQRRPYRPRRL